MAIHYQNCIWNVINISLYISLFRSLVNLILDPLSPRLSVRPKHNPTLALPLLHTPQNWKEISTLRQVCLHAHAHAHTLACRQNWDVQGSSRSSGPSALIWTNPWKPWPGPSEGLHRASSYIYAAFSHPAISRIFRGPGNPSAHSRVKSWSISLDVRCAHVPAIVARSSFFILPPKTYSGVECVFCAMPGRLFVL